MVNKGIINLIIKSRDGYKTFGNYKAIYMQESGEIT